MGMFTPSDHGGSNEVPPPGWVSDLSDPDTLRDWPLAGDTFPTREKVPTQPMVRNQEYMAWNSRSYGGPQSSRSCEVRTLWACGA